MHIKSIHIQGFKSYRDQSFTAQEFSSKINVVVGRNGSGKSNFFNAIHFVFGDKYAHLRTEERQALLHEGTGRGVMSAFVEITFDNTDGRLPFDKDTVTIRRTIGLKKDEYRLDGKTMSQREILNILESAGLSAANPYYIVAQGRVAALTTMKDNERLNLLKEVAGTKVYDTRRAESLKIMRDSELKIARIDEVIESIEERLSELEKEKKELKEFQELDKKRKVLSYHLYDNEMKEANRQLEDLNNHRQNLHKESADLHLRKQESHQQVKFIERTIKDEELKVNDLAKQKQIYEKQRESLIREKTKVQLELASINEKLVGESEQKSSIRKELTSLEKEIAKARKDIEDVVPKLNDAKNNESQLRERLYKSEQRLSQLYSKQGRKKNFSTVEERDDWLKEQINKQTQILNNTTSRIGLLEKECSSLSSNIDNTQQGREEKNDELQKLKKEMEEIQKTYSQLSDERNSLADERKERWKKENDAEEALKKVRDDLTRTERRLESTLPKNLNKGIEEIRRIVREQNIQGVYGTVIELFTARDTYYRACEVTAGSALFHVVVESDKVAAEILEIMNRQKAKGRVTFMPLNRITGKTSDVPQDPVHTPLLSKLNFDPKFKNVFSRIFGQTYVSPTLESATDFARSNNVDCVTLKGDQVNKKGALTGGFVEERESRMDCMAQINNLKKSHGRANQEAKKSKDALTELDNRITAIIGRMRGLEAEMHRLRNAINQMNMQVSLQATRAQQWQESLTQKQRNLERAREEQKRLQEEISTLKDEIGTPLTSTLSTNEQTELDTLNQQIDQIQKDLRGSEKSRVSLETNRKVLIAQLNNNLLKRQSELEETLKNLEVSEYGQLGTAPQQLQKTIENLNSEIEQIDSKLEELDDQIKSSQKTITAKQKEIDARKTQDQHLVRQVETDQNRLEKLLNRRKMLEQKRDQAVNNIRELGTIPKIDPGVDTDDNDAIIRRLHKANDKLKKFAHVNKKALDQYDQFDEQRKGFIEKKRELDEGASAIRDLIKTLDQQKDEAIERTFKQVSMNFSQVFTELVPGGNASLVMNRQSADGDDEEEEAEDESSTISAYSGVSIIVKFTGDGEAQVMQQLSGGQKSIVALALIFAIQQCDPAPFYLFDEIDAALDPNYRTSVAQMIQKQSENSQFIITTFKTEMLDYADNFYGISHKNKVSIIRSIEKDDAAKVLQEEERLQGEGGGDEPSEEVPPEDQMRDD